MIVDVIVVGAGPAGLALAIDAARNGLSTVVFERGSVPVDKACGEGVMPSGVRVLERLGVRALLGPEDAVPLRAVRYVQEDGSSVTGALPDGGGLGIRRTALASALLARAAEVGVEVRAHSGVRAHRRDGDLIEVQTDGETLHGRILVAADGLGSPRRAAEGLDGPPAVHRRFGLRQHFRVQPWSDAVEVHLADGVEAYVTPSGVDRVGVAFLWEHGRLPPPVGVAPLLARFPALAARLAGAPPDSSARGAGPLARRARRLCNGRVVLLGDAAGYVDAITGEGLSVALACAEALARCLPAAVARGAAAATLVPYRRAFRRLFRKYALVARTVLAIARRPWLRRRVLGVLGRHPGLFRWLLARAIA